MIRPACLVQPRSGVCDEPRSLLTAVAHLLRIGLRSVDNFLFAMPVSDRRAVGLQGSLLGVTALAFRIAGPKLVEPTCARTRAFRTRSRFNVFNVFWFVPFLCPSRVPC